MTSYTMNSPLELFILQKFMNLKIFGFQVFSLTNQLIMIALFVLLVVWLTISLLNKDFSSTKAMRTPTFVLFTKVYKFILGLVDDNIHTPDKGIFVPYIFTLFIIVAGFNIIGLIPYTFAVTGQLAFTLTLSYLTFFLTLFAGFKKHGTHYFARFFPGNLNIALAPILVPIELVSYFFQPISLAVRLFANIMAGHILLNVFSMFVFMLASASGSLALMQIIPLFLLIPLCLLELAVALIQAYVFCLLTCIYINDTLNLH